MAREEAPQPSEEEAAEKIRQEQELVRCVQEWWADGLGPAAAARSPVLAAIDESVLAEVVSAGGGYHTILTADRLDGLHRRLGAGAEPALEPLRKALQTRGGSKAQARVVGMLLFREARALRDQCAAQDSVQANGPDTEAAGAALAAHQPAQKVGSDEAAPEVRLDEAWSPARKWVCAETYPDGAQMALREAPDAKSRLLTKAPAGTEYLATGRSGDFLQVHVEIDGASVTAYALHTMSGLTLLKPDVVLDETWPLPRRFVCSEHYPAGAQMAVRAGPSRESKQMAALPAGSEYLATGRSGDYLQIQLEIDGSQTTAYVTHAIGDMILLVPAEPVQASECGPSADKTVAPTAAKAVAVAAAACAEAASAAAAAEAANGGRVAALEARGLAQERQILALQQEVNSLKHQLRTIASAFAPLAAATAGGG